MIKIDNIISAEHHFVYSNPGAVRTNLLKEIAAKYPLRVCSSRPAVIYTDDLGLAKLPIKGGVNSYPVDLVASVYPEISLCLAVVEKILNSDPSTIAEISSYSEDLFASLNSTYLNKAVGEVHSYEDLRDYLKLVLTSYKEHYQSYILEGVTKTTILTDFDLASFLREFRATINALSHTVFILDNNKLMHPHCYNSINRLMSTLSPKESSINVVTSFDDWQSYYTLASEMLFPHEQYEVIDLDGNFTEAQEKLMKKYDIEKIGK